MQLLDSQEWVGRERVELEAQEEQQDTPKELEELDSKREMDGYPN